MNAQSVNDFPSRLVTRYAREVAHLRQLFEAKRMGLVLGAGVSKAANLPNWNDLIERVAAELGNRGLTIPGLETKAPPVQTQIMFSRFRDKTFDDDDVRSLSQPYKDAEVAARWRKLVHKILYSGVDNIEEKIDNHPYLDVLAALAFRIPLVISYNYDDLLERALARHVAQVRHSHTVGYYAAWGPNFLLQDDRPVVYHPNGYLPFDLIDRYSDNVVLTEEALSDQIIGYGLGEYATLLDYVTTRSCLFIGFSLNDSAQRTLLRQAVHRAPGNVHYFVHFMDGKTKISEQEMTDLRATNFDLFNVVTLFLDCHDCRTLFDLVAVSKDDQFDDAFFRAGKPEVYRYYVAGPVSIGKSSAISRLQGLTVVDEWLSPKDPLIAKTSHELTDEQRQKVDDWIMEQLRLKNKRFCTANRGIHIMDRAPLDAFAFTSPGDEAAKAKMIWERVCGGGIGRHPISLAPGCVVFLKGRPDDLAMRQRWRGRTGDADYIERQQTALEKIYQGPGTHVLDISGNSIEVVVRRLARLIHLGDYDEFDFTGRLEEYLAQESHKPPTTDQ